MIKTKLISFCGIDPKFESRTPIDLSEISNKSFIIKFDMLNSAKQFKHVLDKSNFLLANIINNLESKKGFAASKKLALQNMFAKEQNKDRLKFNNEKLTKFR